MTARNDAAREAARLILAADPTIGPRALAARLSISPATAHSILSNLRTTGTTMPTAPATIDAAAKLLPAHPLPVTGAEDDPEAILAAAEAEAAAAEAATAARLAAARAAAAAAAEARKQRAEDEARAKAEAARIAAEIAARPAPVAAAVAAVAAVAAAADLGLPPIVSRWRAVVPAPCKGWVGRAAELGALADWMSHPEDGPCMLAGPKGSGKTSLLREACARAGRTMLRINGHRDMAASDLIGTWIVRSDRSLAWNDGPLPAAMRAGAVLLVDESDRIPSGTASCMQAVLEGGGEPLTIPETGEIVHPAPGFRIVATANSVGDSTGGYAAAVAVDEATLDRYDLVMHVDPMQGAELEKLARGAAPLITADKLTLALSYHASLTAAAAAGDLRSTPSPRRLRAFARLLSRGWQAEAAAAAAYSDRLDPAEAEAVRSILTRLLSTLAAPAPAAAPAVTP